jgi:hypothetical protein
MLAVTQEDGRRRDASQIRLISTSSCSFRED